MRLVKAFIHLCDILEVLKVSDWANIYSMTKERGSKLPGYVKISPNLDGLKFHGNINHGAFLL